MRAPEVRLSPKFHSCECDFNALSGWVGGRRVRAPQSHLCITQWGGGGVTYVYVRSVTLCRTTDRPAHPLPLVGVPKPRLRSKIFRGRAVGLKNPESKVLRSEAEVKIDEPTQTSAFQGTTKPTTH
jgi:hypothetical protein